MVVLGPDSGEGGEDEVYEAVDKGHVGSEDLDDGLGAYEAEGADEGRGENFRSGSIGRLEFGVKGGIAGFLLQAVRFALQENGWV